MDVTREELKDAVQKIETVSSIVHTHIGAQGVINKAVEKNTSDIAALQINAERTSGTIALVDSKVDRLIEIASNNRIGWQVWLPFAAVIALNIIGLIAQFWPKGVTQ